jgi:hypothetical protein
MQKSYVIVFDFESFGGIPSINGFSEFGAVLMEVPTGKVLETYHSFASQDKYYRNQRCMDEFWSKFPERLAETNKYTLFAPNPENIINNFMWWCEKNARTYNIMNNIHLITDNSSFDTALLAHFSTGTDIKYVFGEYRPVIDVTMYYYGVAKMLMNVESFNELKISSKQNAMISLGVQDFGIDNIHDHNPVNDATHIGLWWCAIQAQIWLSKS